MLRALGRLPPRPPSRPPTPAPQPARGRKSRHDPPAKSKVGRVATPPPVDPAELFVVTERYRLYRETVGALRQQFSRQVRSEQREARVGVEASRRAQREADEHRALLAWNQAENRRLQALRLVRLQREAREQERQRAEERARRDREEEERLRLREQEVLRLQEAAKSFITRENLDAKVEEALDSPRSYNWAVTREGQVLGPGHEGS